MIQRIAIIGVGLLGSAVASRLLTGGFAVTGYDSRPDQLKALRPRGLEAASSVKEAVTGADADLHDPALPRDGRGGGRRPRGILASLARLGAR